MSSPKRIVFLDETCPKPYSTLSLANIPMGGTEATVVRVADALSRAGYEVIVAQHNHPVLSTVALPGGATYISLDGLDHIQHSPHAVIALRTPTTLPMIRERWGKDPKAFLWCHDFNQQDLVTHYEKLKAVHTKVLGVSKTHKQLIATTLLSQIPTVENVTVDYVYNPIGDALLPDATQVYTRKLVYFSSPHKGLERTLRMFERVRALDHNYELYIANPGYLPSVDVKMEGVTNLGELPHHEVMKHVRQAYCVFHMNQYPETFGLVYAEAAAVGTPVLTSPAGAVPEILQDPEFYVNVTDPKAVIDRLEKWQRNKRPVPKLRSEVRLSNVIKKWEALLNGP